MNHHHRPSWRTTALLIAVLAAGWFAYHHAPWQSLFGHL